MNYKNSYKVKRKKLLLICIIIISILLSTVGCTQMTQPVAGKISVEKDAVKITDMGNYFDVHIDAEGATSHYELGVQYGEAILEVVPDYIELIDSYVKELAYSERFYENAIVNRIADIIPQMNKDYWEEVKGMASVFANCEEDIAGDGKLSVNEFFLFNLEPDVLRGTQCNAVSVFGSKSETNNTIMSRNLDWIGGSNNQLPKIQATITIKSKYNDVFFVGYMGFMGALTGINEKKVFGAILDSPSGQPYNSQGRRSYTFDLREALEKGDSLQEVADFMMDSKKLYAWNHLIALSDPDGSKILENNFSSNEIINGERVKRALRSDDSPLNEGIEWGIDNAVATVNSFLLQGNHDNHTGQDNNIERWETIKEQLKLKGDTVSFEEMKEIASYDDGKPDYMRDGDLYCKMTVQIVVVEPETFTLEIFFFPKDTLISPVDPSFIKVKPFENE